MPTVSGATERGARSLRWSPRSMRVVPRSAHGGFVPLDEAAVFLLTSSPPSKRDDGGQDMSERSQRPEHEDVEGSGPTDLASNDDAKKGTPASAKKRREGGTSQISEMMTPIL